MNGSRMLAEATAPTLIDMLRLRATQQPDQTAYTFIDDDDRDGRSCSYAELDRQARTIAAQLQALDLQGQRVLLLYPPGPEYIAAFYGCLYAGVIAVPAYPPAANRPDLRIHAIVVDSQAAAVLTTPHILATQEARLRQTPGLEHLRWLALRADLTDAAERWIAPDLSSRDLAFLQYTSGSTATPKGVMLSHGNLLYNLAQIQDKFQLTSASHGVIWLPPYHDMGLIGGILEPLYVGFPVTLLPPISFLKRPLHWLEIISRVGGTCSGGPNFAFDLCARKIRPEERATLDLRSWDVAFCGAEPIRRETMEQFTAAFAPCGFRPEAFYPCYGLAEATLIVSGGIKAHKPAMRSFGSAELEQNQVVAVADDDAASSRTLIGCGQSVVGQRIAIVDPQTGRRCDEGQVGEIWIAGPSVAQGYWRQAAATQQTFGARIADTGEGPFLRSGDLGFVHENELFVTGRLKDLIIIRGRNYYPQDIELSVEQAHPALRPGCGAAFAIDVDGQEALVVVQELVRQHAQWETAEILSAIRGAVAERHDLQVHTVLLIRSGTIPKTSSGKIQRHACRAEFLADRLRVVASSAPVVVEQAAPPTLTLSALAALSPGERHAAVVGYLRALLAQQLSLPVAAIDPARSLSTLGLDSLALVGLQHSVEAATGAKVTIASLLSGPTLDQLAAEVVGQLAEHQAAAPPSEAETKVATLFPLSHGQAALWFFHELMPQSLQYHIARAAQIDGALDIPALRQAFEQLVDRHAALRSTFHARSSGLLQQVHDRAELCFDVEDAAGYSSEQLQARLREAAAQPFDLSAGPLLRVHVFTRSSRQQIVLLCIHHIAADFWSLAILIDELRQLYTAARSGHPAAVLPLQASYREYVIAQQELLAGADGERQWQYWREQLAGTLPILDLPSDRPRPAALSDHAAAYRFAVPAELLPGLTRLAAEHAATLYTVLLAAFFVLLQRHSHQNDLIVGSPFVARTRHWHSRLVGYLVNLLPIRADLSGDPSFAALLQQMRALLVGALEHQDMPFALLVERVQPQRQLNRSPLFQAVFALQKAHLLHGDGLSGFALELPGQRMAFDELEIESWPLEQHAREFDITLSMAEIDGGLSGLFEYNTALFDGETIACLAQRYVCLLRSILAAPEQRLSRLPLLPPAECTRLLIDWNATERPYAADTTLTGLLEAQAARTPDALALLAEDGRLSYRELHAQANQVAWSLRRLGVGPETRIGLYLERSRLLVVGLLAILKAGGAYVPLDPEYPRERLDFIIDDADVSIVLTQRSLIGDVPTQRAALVCLDDAAALAQEPRDDLPPTAQPGNLAYIIYTSGSTGRPKGVAIEHRNVVNFMRWAHEVYTAQDFAGTLASTSICFDFSVFEIFAPLSCGGAVILAKNALHLSALAATSTVTMVNTVPSAMTELLQLGGLPATVQIVNLGGEALTQTLAQQVYAQPGVRLVRNLYGPSEITTCASHLPIERGSQAAVTIGRPIANTRIYLLDRQLQLVPSGVPGEIYIGGAGVARGYLDRPALTAERFIPDPFSHGARPGSRLYKSGDLARFRPDGTIEFLGRLDQQIKLRGFRIELGEIEAALRRHPAVRDAVVLALGEGETQRLVAYLVENKEPVARWAHREQRAEPGRPEGTRNQEPGTETPGGYPEPGTENQEQGNRGPSGRTTEQTESLAAELRAFLRRSLPDYMVPAAFVFLPALPLMPNGKLDRKALPTPGDTRPALDQLYVAPRNPTETTIAAIWAELLGLDRVGVHDNFFALGGHSLLATRVIMRLREEFGPDLPLQLVFEQPTVAQLAEQLAARQPGAAPAQSIPRLKRTPYKR
jgi:amino acid adenylation domain-containing protein